MQDWLVAVLPVGATQASVPFPAKIVEAHDVPLAQSELEQHVSSQVFAVQTPERQSLSVVHAAPGAEAHEDLTTLACLMGMDPALAGSMPHQGVRCDCTRDAFAWVGRP